MGMAGACNFQLGTHHQRMAELACRLHGLRWNRAVVGRHKVHQTKAQGLNAGVPCNRKRVVNSGG